MRPPRFNQRLADLPASFHVPARPNPVAGARLVAASAGTAALLGLDVADLEDPRWLAWLSGAELPPGAQPLASAYAGHQFGVYVPLLGDGRAVLLGDLPGADGTRYEVQLKGVGPTAFARGADGRVGLTAALRELFISEALAGLGIPTARVLAVLAGTERIAREVVEPAAVVVRVAPTHLRFGHFEYAHWRGMPDGVRALADFVIAHHWPDCAAQADPYRALLEAVVRASARLVALWQAYGFAHGVLNTDNMGLLGHTLDIGPTRFVEAFVPDRPHNASDRGGRYTFARQAAIVGWNLRALGHAVQSLVPLADQHALANLYETQFLHDYGTAMRARLGLATAGADDAALVDALLALLARTQADYPAFLRALGDYAPDVPATTAPLRALVGDAAGLDDWLAAYAARLAADGRSAAERRAAMHAVNPRYSARVLAVQAACARASEGDDAPARLLLASVSRPFDVHPGAEHLAAPAPPGAAPPPLSCLT